MWAIAMHNYTLLNNNLKKSKVTMGERNLNFKYFFRKYRVF